MFKAVLVYNLHMASFFFLRNSLNSKRIISLLLVNQLILSGMLQLGVIALLCLKMILAFLLVGHLHKSEIILFCSSSFFFFFFIILLTNNNKKSSAKQFCEEKLFMSGVCQKKQQLCKQFKQSQEILEKYYVASS